MNSYLSLYRSLFLTVGVCLLSTVIVFSQNTIMPVHVFDKLTRTEWSGKENGAIQSEEEKLKFLELLPEGEKVDFIMDYSEEGGDTTYWEFQLKGLYSIDLDFDGDLDLLYSGVNGNMRQTATKLYYNQNGSLIYHSTLRDGIMDIKRNENDITIYTLFLPCCDFSSVLDMNLLFAFGTNYNHST